MHHSVMPIRPGKKSIKKPETDQSSTSLEFLLGFGDLGRGLGLHSSVFRYMAIVFSVCKVLFPGYRHLVVP